MRSADVRPRSTRRRVSISTAAGLAVLATGIGLSVELAHRGDDASADQARAPAHEAREVAGAPGHRDLELLPLNDGQSPITFADRAESVSPVQEHPKPPSAPSARLAPRKRPAPQPASEPVTLAGEPAPAPEPEPAPAPTPEAAPAPVNAAPAYEPGSVRKAKDRWLATASKGKGSDDGGSISIRVSGGHGYCPPRGTVGY